MLLLSSPSSLNWNDSNGGVAQARKLIVAQVTPHHSSPRHNVTIDVDDVGTIPARQVGIDLRRIPPSTSNPTQNNVQEDVFYSGQIIRGRSGGNYLRGGIAVRFMTDDNRLTKDYKLVYLSPTNKSSLHRCQLRADGDWGKPCYVSSVVLSEVETSMLLVFVVHDEVCSYNIQDGDLRKLGSVGIYDPTLIPYVNSLRPCGEQEELLEAI
ncbi:hypothetical protein B296_00026383 [Ensete ventricosum]|uniref:Uncharacterized protein n=1 Tax=Ensete ventricosum TaxID=4639 RepID=A0A426XTJ9_ENSVE|nr:hypothetical protein B296_00026383 [Ensete ventricosum]